MKVELIKVHPCWNTLYPDEFVVGDTLELDGDILTTKNDNEFSAHELCKSFSNRCSYSDIIKKTEDEPINKD